MQVGRQLSALLGRQGVPVEVNVAGGRAVRRLQVEPARRQVLGIEGNVSCKVVELEAVSFLEGKPLQLNVERRRVLIEGEFAELKFRVTKGEVIHVEAFHGVRARNVVRQAIR